MQCCLQRAQRQQPQPDLDETQTREYGFSKVYYFTILLQEGFVSAKTFWIRYYN